MPPFFSVVIPTYNRSAYVTEAVKSVLTQGFRDAEVIVVDDCSTDQTAAALAPYAGPGFMLLRTPANGGVAAARNLGIGAASGRYVLFLDDDDTLLADALSTIHGHHERFPDIAFSWCGIQTERCGSVGELIGVSERLWSPADGGCAGRGQLAFVLNIGTNFGLCVRREALEQVGLFDTALRRSEDKDLLLRLAQAGCTGKGIDKILVRYSDHMRGSLCRPLGGRMTPDADEAVMAKHGEFLKRRENRLFRAHYASEIFALHCDNGNFMRALAYLVIVSRWRPAFLPRLLEKLIRVFSGLEALKNRLGYHSWNTGARSKAAAGKSGAASASPK